MGEQMMNQQMKRGSAGFSLMELMIAVVIVGILAAVAVPSYRSSQQKGDRASAKSMMLQVAQREERHYTENNVYAALATLGYGAHVYSDGNSHEITIALANSNSTYTITATPASTDSTCGNLTLTNTGAWSNSQGASASSC